MFLKIIFLILLLMKMLRRQLAKQTIVHARFLTGILRVKFLVGVRVGAFINLGEMLEKDESLTALVFLCYLK